MSFQHRFLIVLAPFWKPRWVQNRSKIDQNWVSEPSCFGIVFYIDFWSSFASNFDLLDLKKPSFSLGKTMIFKKSPFEVNIDFWSDFDANMPPCWLPKSQIFQIFGVPRRLKIFIDFGIDFLSILGPSWPPTWGHLGSQDGSKSEKMGPKHWDGASQERFWLRRCFWTPFKSVLPSILGVSGLDFQKILG